MSSDNINPRPVAVGRLAAIARSLGRSGPGPAASAAGAIGLGVALNWSWLSAAGAAPLILSVLPSAAMCALGLCAPGIIGRKPTGSDVTDETSLK